MGTNSISIVNRKLTHFREHFVTLVEDKDLQVGQVKVTTLNELEDSAWCANNDVWLLDSLKEGHVLVQRDTAKNYLSADVWHLPLESMELFLDLVGEFSVVAEDKSGAGLRVHWELMQDGQHEDCSLAHTRLGLAQDIDTNHSLRDALLLHF